MTEDCESGLGATASPPLLDPEEVFAALADPTRRQILRTLSHEGPLSATDLAGQFPVSRQAVVKHLSTLAHAGLLHGERQGREVLYELVPGRLDDATAWLDEVGRSWDRRLAALVQHFSSPGSASSGGGGSAGPSRADGGGPGPGTGTGTGPGTGGTGGGGDGRGARDRGQG